VENRRHLGIVGICNVDWNYTLLVPHYVLCSGHELIPSKWVWEGALPGLLQTEQAAAFDAGWELAVGISAG
jgi:hypothetical protein